VLEEAGSDYQPRHDELVEYARWLGTSYILNPKPWALTLNHVPYRKPKNSLSWPVYP